MPSWDLPELALLGALALAVLALFSSVQVVHRVALVSHEGTRKFAHVAATAVAGSLPLLGVERSVLMGLAVVLGAALWLGAQRGWFPGVVSAERSIGGPLWLLAAYATLAWICPSNRAFGLGFWVLALADAAASLAGRRWGRQRIAPHSQRTWVGSAACFATAACTAFAACLAFGTPLVVAACVGLSVAAVAAGAEASVPSSFDNFVIPVAVAAMFGVQETWSVEQAWWHLGEIVVAFTVVAVGYFGGWLLGDAALASLALGVSIVALAGWRVGLLLLLCLSSVNLLTRLRPGLGAQGDASGRRACQVIAFGVMPALCAFLYARTGESWAIAGIVGAMAAAVADTWATEIGKLSRRAPRLVTTGERVAKGTSGGITALGLLASAAGAIVTAGIALGLELVRVGQLGLVLAAGAGASLLDSWIGAVAQAHYQCAQCSARSEGPGDCHGRPRRLVAGFRWLDNEMVNFTISLAATVVVAGWLWLGR
jgi:uncharacterized protein (TIGR00297 family)